MATATLFRTTHPIDFSIFDKDSQNVLYIEDGADQLLTLEIRNLSATDIVLKDLDTAPLSATNFHFALRFRPGTLAQKLQGGTKSIELTSSTARSDWEMLQVYHDNENTDVIYLRRRGGITLKCQTAVENDPWQTIVFNHVGADGSQGARGTRVELICTNMHYLGSDEPINTVREIHLGIINHRGKKNIPLEIGFVGGNAVINNGLPNKPLTLRIANIARYNALNPTQSNISFKYDPTTPTKTTKFFLSFQSGENNDPWALDTEAVLAKSIQIAQLTDWTVIKPNEGEKMVWTLSPSTKTITLQSMDDPAKNKVSHLDIIINDIVSSFPCGQTYLYIYYQNIPGYWDGSFACILEKTPVNVSQNLVELNADLSIKNANAELVHVSKDDVNVQTTLTCKGGFQITGAGDNVIDISDAATKATLMRIGTYLTANNIENYNRPLLIKNTGTDKKTVELARFTIDGKLGLGNIPAPSARLDIAVDKGIPALQLQNGNISTDKIEDQITLSYQGTKDGYRHSIKTRHNGFEGPGNAIDFYVWDHSKDTVSVIGSKHNMSLNNGKVGIGGITQPAATLDVNGDIVCRAQGSDDTIGLTLKNGRIWCNSRSGGLWVGTELRGFLGSTGSGVGIWHQADGKTGEWIFSAQQKPTRGEANEVRINGKLFIQVIDQLQEKQTRYLVHKPSNQEIGWYDSSDLRLKKNIATISSPLGALQQLRGVSYQWNEIGLSQKTIEVESDYRAASDTPEDNQKVWDQEKKRILEENSRTFRGFIAQEVETVFPDWVKEDKHGYKTINTDELVPIMVESIKEQQRQIEDLQGQIDKLMNQMKTLASSLQTK